MTKEIRKCASRWSFSRICITMHGSENIKFIWQEQRCIQNFGGKTRGKETTGKT